MIFENGKYNFNTDLSIGLQGEAYIREFLETLKFVYVDTCSDKRYDLRMSYKGKECTYEIKTDVYERNTGNMAIEFESRGKASGISVTEADYFVYFFPLWGEIWNIKTSELRALIAENKFYVKNGGDKGSNTKFYLINKEKVRTRYKVYLIEPFQSQVQK